MGLNESSSSIICTQHTAAKFFEKCSEYKYAGNRLTFREYMDDRGLYIDTTGYNNYHFFPMEKNDYVLMELYATDLIELCVDYVCCREQDEEKCRRFPGRRIIPIKCERLTRFDVYYTLDRITSRSEIRGPTYSELQAEITKLKAKNKKLNDRLTRLLDT